MAASCLRREEFLVTIDGCKRLEELEILECRSVMKAGKCKESKKLEKLGSSGKEGMGGKAKSGISLANSPMFGKLGKLGVSGELCSRELAASDADSDNIRIAMERSEQQARDIRNAARRIVFITAIVDSQSMRRESRSCFLQ
ncbi:hypothetical protein HPP92_012198 [Vanilla planifolia]|uniref:Uncharacterized protein n=1 Tax=Vanilla planifolia TaxID=51239 RepID=A0A835QX37_VANPL|nr:hypothetical protein HPP92_012198 [Vanilla planifolia]